MGTQAPEAPQIQTTKIYGLFKLMGGNRPIDYNHVKRLKRSMQEHPDMFRSKPIEVNENMYIIDGQHRRLAAQELGMPVYYVVVDGGSLEETRVGNVTQRRWTLMDFANSYATSGREDYKKFVSMVKEFDMVSPSIVRMYLLGTRPGNVEQDFRSGDFRIQDEEVARDGLKKLAEVIKKTGIQMNAPMARGLFQLFNGLGPKNADPFDFELFSKKLEREAARDLFGTAPSIRASLRSIENVYNFQSKFQARLY